MWGEKGYYIEHFILIIGHLEDSLAVVSVQGRKVIVSQCF